MHEVDSFKLKNKNAVLQGAGKKLNSDYDDKSVMSALIPHEISPQGASHTTERWNR